MMHKSIFAALALVGASLPAMALAQSVTTITQPISGTRLDISATGEVTRIPDIAIISAGVTTLDKTATGAIEQNAAQMEQVRAALKRAGIAERDIQTSSFNLNPEYRYENNLPPVLTGYRVSNQVSVRFRDIKATGKILDALVAQGANQINGPSLTIDKPEQAMDEARVKAIAAGQVRAELYARALGKKVVRMLSISESGGYSAPPPIMMRATMADSAAKTAIDPGEQQLSVSLSMSFELQ